MEYDEEMIGILGEAEHMFAPIDVTGVTAKANRLRRPICRRGSDTQTQDRSRKSATEMFSNLNMNTGTADCGITKARRISPVGT